MFKYLHPTATQVRRAHRSILKVLSLPNHREDPRTRANVLEWWGVLVRAKAYWAVEACAVQVRDYLKQPPHLPAPRPTGATGATMSTPPFSTFNGAAHAAAWSAYWDNKDAAERRYAANTRWMMFHHGVFSPEQSRHIDLAERIYVADLEAAKGEWEAFCAMWHARFAF